jgi:peptide/nickel transport system substrate-binding protein
MERRRFMKAGVGSGTLVGLAGCTGGSDDETNQTNQTNDSSTGDQPTTEADIEYEPVPEQEFIVIARNWSSKLYEHNVIARRQLERLGFQFDFNVLEVGAWVDKFLQHEWDLTTSAWAGSPERIFPYYNLYFSFHSSFADEESSEQPGFKFDKYDQAVERMTRSVDRETQQEACYRCQEILGANAASLFTVHPAALVAANTTQFTGWKERIGNMAYSNVNSLRDIEPTDGADTVVYGTPRALQNYPNFMAVTGPDAIMVHVLNYDTLSRLSYEGEPQPAAAEDWEWEDDATFVVTLRDGMTWHDGERVTADDLVFTWEFANEHGIPYLSSDLEPFESAEKLDERTVRMNLAEAFGGWTIVSLTRIPILPQHVWDGVTEEQDLSHPSEWSDPDMTGSGPFQFVDYQPGNQIVFEKNPDHYWADDISFERFVYKVYETESALVGDIISGTATFGQYLNPNNWQRAKENSNVKATENPNLQTNNVYMNIRREPFNDVLVRKALAHAVNKQEILDVVYQGLGETASSPVAPANSFFHNEDTPYFEGNLSKARDLLAQSGFRWDDNGQLMIPVDWEPSQTYVNP